MIYDIEGEEWIPEGEAKKQYGVTSEQLNEAVARKVLRTKPMFNSEWNRKFRVFSVSDMELLCYQKLFGFGKAGKPSRKEVENWLKHGDALGSWFI